MWPLFIYLALASIVHPWYIIPLVAFSVFSHYRFPVVWSFAAFFSYAGYNAYGFEHPYLIYALEYILVFGVAVYELKRKFPFGISGLKQLKQSFTS
jgi:alpha-1,6-mannosyltransferase